MPQTSRRIRRERRIKRENSLLRRGLISKTEAFNKLSAFAHQLFQEDYYRRRYEQESAQDGLTT